jgi:hypothetical protein
MASRGVGKDNELIFWDLDRHGRLFHQVEPADAAASPNKMIGSLLHYC